MNNNYPILTKLSKLSEEERKKVISIMTDSQKKDYKKELEKLNSSVVIIMDVFEKFKKAIIDVTSITIPIMQQFVKEIEKKT